MCEVYNVALEAAPHFGAKIPATCPLDKGSEGEVSCLLADPTGVTPKIDVIRFLQNQIWGAQQIEKFLARLEAAKKL